MEQFQRVLVFVLGILVLQIISANLPMSHWVEKLELRRKLQHATTGLAFLVCHRLDFTGSATYRAYIYVFCSCFIWTVVALRPRYPGLNKAPGATSFFVGMTRAWHVRRTWRP